MQKHAVIYIYEGTSKYKTAIFNMGFLQNFCMDLLQLKGAQALSNTFQVMCVKYL